MVIVIIFLTSSSVVLGVRGINIINLVMQYDENGNSKWFAPEPTPIPLTITPYTKEIIIEQINDKRTEGNVNKYVENELLNKAAETKAQDMMDKNYFDYIGPDKKDWWLQITNSGYDYENANIAIAQGYVLANGVIEEWFNNEEIKKNILDKKFEDIGVSVKNGKYLGTESTLVVVYFANLRPKNLQQEGAIKTSKITCTGPDGKSFLATQKDCDDFNAKWGNVKKTTTAPASLPIQAKPTYNNFVTVSCTTVYGVYASYGKDYSEANSYCENLKQYSLNLQKSVPTVYIPSTQTYPTSTPQYDNTEDCNSIRSEWQSFKENFMANNYNNYGSSAQAISALEGYRQSYQQTYTSYGCTGSLSLY